MLKCRIVSHYVGRPSSNPVTDSSSDTGTVIPFKYPKSLAEVDNGQILGFGAELAENHPGFHDTDYKHRRYEISLLAKQHRLGTPIPTLEYLPEECSTWATVLNQLEPLYGQHACKEYLQTYPLFNFSPSEVPQLEQLNKRLQRATGWQIRPTAGLLHPRDFLAGLAFRCFHSTQYMRHKTNPHYTPEPDIIHEALGHVPMLANEAFCDVVHKIGLASLGADDKEIWRLAKIYWFTVEFGVVREDDELKAFGAGILSSVGEMQNMACGDSNVEFEPFDPFSPLPAMNYKNGVQQRYYVLENFESAAERLTEYCRMVQSKYVR